MTEPIGLQGIFEMEGFDQGLAKYLQGIDKANTETDKVASNFGKGFNEMGSKVNSLAGTMGTVLVGATAGAGVALGSFAVKGIQQAEEMEKQLSVIASIMGKTKDQVKPLADEIVKLGLDPNLMVDATQAADAIQQLAKNGLTMDQIVQGAAKSTVLLANATGADFGSAADTATATMKLFNIDAKDMEKAVSGIVGVTTNSKLTFNDYALALANGGGAAKAMGLSFKDFNTILAGTSSYFSSGGDAATSLKTMLLRLAAPTDEAKKLMKDLGLQVFDAKGQMLPFPQVLANLEKAMSGSYTATVKMGGATGENAKAAKHYQAVIAETKQKLMDYQTGVAGVAQSENDKKVAIDRLQRTLKSATDAYNALGVSQGTTKQVTVQMTEETRNQALATLFGSDAMREAVALLDLGSDGYKKLQDTMSKTDATEQAATRMNNLAGVIEITKGAIDAIALQVGQAFLPMITDMAKSISQFVSDNGSKLSDWFQQVAYAIEAFVNMDTADINWENIVPPFLVPTMYAVGQGFDYLFNVVQAFREGVVSFDFPWETILPPGIADVAYAISGAIEFVGDHLDAFKGALMGIGAVLASSSIMAILTGIATAIAALNLPLIALVAGAALVGAAWNDNWFGIRDATMPILAALGTAIEGVITIVQGFTSSSPGAYPWEEIFPGWLGDTLAVIGSAIQSVETIIKDFNAGVFGFDYDWNKVFPPSLAQVASASSTAIQTMANVMQSVQQAFEPLTTAIAQNGAGALQEIYNFATGNQTSFENVQAIWNGLTATATNIFSGIAPIVQSAFSAFSAALAPWATEAVAWITQAVTDAPGKIGEWYTALTGSLTEYLGQWTGYLVDWAAPLINWIDTSTGGIGAKIVAWFTSLTSAVSSHIGEWVSYLIDWSDPLVNWVDDAVRNLGPKITAWYNGLTGTVSSFVNNWQNYLQAWSDPLIQWIDTAVKGLPNKITAWYTGLTGEVSSHIGEWVSYLIDWSDPLVNWIDTAISNAPAKIQAWYSGLSSEVAKNLPNWISNFQTWATNAVQWLSDATTQIGPKITEFTTKLISLLAAKLPDWIAAFFDFAAAATSWISTAIAALPIALGLFLSKLITWVGGEGLQGITSAVAQWATAFLGWVDSDLIPKVAPAMGRFFAELVVGIGKITAGIGIYVVLVSKAIIDTLMATDWQQVGIDLMTLLIKGIESLLSLMQSTIDSFVTTIQNKFSDVDWVGLGSQVMQYIVSGLSSMLGNLEAKAKELSDAVLEKFTDVDWKQLGTDIVHFISDGTVAALSYLETGLNFIVADAQAIWTAIDWGKLGTDLINLIKDAAVNAASSLYDSFQTIVETAKKKFTDFDWGAAGQAVVDGIKAGIDKAKDLLMQKVQDICDAIIAKIKNALDWHSPAGKTIPAGEAIIDGIIVGMGNRTGKLMSTLQGIMNGVLKVIDQGFNDPSLTSQFSLMWFNDPNFLNTHNLETFTNQLDDLNSQIQDLLSSDTVDLDFVDTAELARLNMANKDLDRRAKLLKFIQDNNLNPKEVLNGQTLAYMQPDQIVRAIQNGMQQIAGMASYSLQQEQDRIQRAYDLRNVTTQTADQMQRMQKLSEKPMNFFQQLQFKRAEQQFSSLTEQMSTARDSYIASGSAVAMATVQSLASTQEALLGKIAGFQRRIFADQVHNEQLTSVLQQQMTMLDQAKALGFNLADLYNNFFNNTDNLADSALQKMGDLQDIIATAGVSMLQRQVAEKALLSSVSTNWNVSGVAQNFAKYYSDAILTPLLNNLKAVVMVENQRIIALNNYNNALKNITATQQKADRLDFLNNQINLLKQVADAGLDIRSVFAGVLSGKSVLGDGANINDLLAIANQLQDQLIKKAQAQLTPQAIALSAQQQQVAQQKQQLDYLNRQLDIIHQGQQAGVNWEGFFSGLTVGINATEQDILTAMSRLYAKLIKQANAELGIASPSKVMMKVGNYMMQGLGVGIQQGFTDLSRMLSTVPMSSVAPRTLNFNMGGVNVNNGMDQYMLESVIERVIERSFA